MDNVKEILSDIRVIIAIAVLVVLLILWFIVQKLRSNKYRRQLQELEVKYNSIKSVPLSFKLNKAVAISRVDPDAMNKVAQTKDDFDKAQANLRQMSQTLAETEDAILVGKLRKAKNNLSDLKASVALGEKQVSDLDKFLDTILEKETAQREEVTELKNQFRELKAEAQENSSRLSQVWPTVEQRISDTERMFSAFEEWMYASDFGKAKAELVNIKSSMASLKDMIDNLPTLLEDIAGVIPQLMQSVYTEYSDSRKNGVYLKHLNIERRCADINNSLREDLAAIKGGDTSDVAAHLENYKAQLKEMDTQIHSECECMEEVRKVAESTEKLFEEAQQNSEYVQKQYQKMSARFGLEGLDENIQQEIASLNELTARKPEVFRVYEAKETPASEVLSALNELNGAIAGCNAGLVEIKNRIDSVTGDEDRAKKQLLKLQVIMNQMQVKIRKYKLPSISEQYEEDMNRANGYIHSLESLIAETPLNVQLLNSTLKEAIDFIYKLYNNVNNVVATVAMVENTIVFGNRYRSTYSDIDSELTRSELCFRNGEYTQALSIAIGTIEKIHPGNYENMIKENAKSAA